MIVLGQQPDLDFREPWLGLEVLMKMPVADFTFGLGQGR